MIIYIHIILRIISFNDSIVCGMHKDTIISISYVNRYPESLKRIDGMMKLPEVEACVSRMNSTASRICYSNRVAFYDQCIELS